MAQELLRGISTTHLYRHDIESLFYIMLLVCGRHTFDPEDDRTSKKARRRVVMRGGTLPYSDWFKPQSYNKLGKDKIVFLREMEPIELSPTFEAFRPWLKEMHRDFMNGFDSKNRSITEGREPNWREKQAGGPASDAISISVPFDDETLGGRVDYSTVIEPTRTLKGELEGLIIRYDTKAEIVQAGAGVDPQ